MESSDRAGIEAIDAADVDRVGSCEALGELTPDLVGIGAIDAEDVDGVGSWEVVGGLASDSAGTKDANEYFDETGHCKCVCDLTLFCNH